MASQLKRYSKQVPKDRSLRASNADRDAVGDILRREHADGRLDTDEFGERFGRSLEAKTYADLDQLIADLPEPDGAPAAPGAGGNWAAQWPERRWAWPRWRPGVLAWLAIAGSLFVLSGYRFLWIFLPLTFMVARPLIWRSYGRGTGPWGRRAPWGHWGYWGCGSGSRGPIV